MQSYEWKVAIRAVARVLQQKGELHPSRLSLHCLPRIPPLIQIIVSEPKPLPVRRVTPPPTRGVRLTWWFTIYLAGQVPLINCALHGQCNILIVVIFPIALGFIFAPIANLLPMPLLPVAVVPLYIAGIAFYIWHFRAALRATSRLRFDLLLLLLDAVILLNQLIVATMATSIRG